MLFLRHLNMAFIAFTNQYSKKLGIFDINFNDIHHLTEDKLSDLFHLIQTSINEPFKDTGKLHVYDVINQLKNLLGELADINIDLNLDFYGVNYSEDILGEWSETYEPRIGIWTGNDKFVLLDQEGSTSIFLSFLNNFE